jgi:hypothetical protein
MAEALGDEGTDENGWILHLAVSNLAGFAGPYASINLKGFAIARPAWYTLPTAWHVVDPSCPQALQKLKSAPYPHYLR